MTSTQRPIRRRMSQCFAVTTFTVGLALGTSAVATAEPEWDVEAYDKCMQKTVRDPVICCIDSGGVPSGQDAQTCGAPDPNIPVPPVLNQRSPEEIVGGPIRDFNAPDVVVPDAPVIVLPAP